MTVSFLFAQLLTGLANASSLFLVAAGLSIIFGVTRVVNFAHGSLTMLGAYLAYSVTTVVAGNLGFVVAVLVAGATVALLGAVIEILVLRRLYGGPELYPLLATFGLVLIIQDATFAIWGPDDKFGPRVPALDGAVTIFGERVPEIDLALIAVGPVVLVGLVALLRGTRWGVLIRATATDPDMAGALGVNARAMFLSAFMLGAFLAGVGGALMVPREPVSLSIDLAIIAEVFVVVVLGGMGSIAGAFVAACLISVLNAFAVLVLPSLSLVLPFVVMGLVLIVRPQGLLGTRASAHGAAVPIAPLRPLPAFARAALVALVPAAAALPFLTDGYALVLLTDLLIALLFAASLQFLMGIGGMVSFGHAAYFGLGAYGAAFTVNALGLPMVAAIGVGVVAALVGAFAFGWFAVRLSGVYLAMLTLAAAQIVWGLTFQLTDVTGGDDGILGVWPARWASGDAAFLWMVIALTALGLAALRHLAHAPFGVMVRAARDHPGRLAALGVDVMRHQWLTFALCGAVAGLAGALLAFAKGSVFPDVLAISQSVDGLVMVLLGGLQSLVGPIFGAGAFVLLEDTLSRLDHWRALFGLMIVAIVLVAPRGLAGLWERRP